MPVSTCTLLEKKVLCDTLRVLWFVPVEHVIGCRTFRVSYGSVFSLPLIVYMFLEALLNFIN